MLIASFYLSLKLPFHPSKIDISILINLTKILINKLYSLKFMEIKIERWNKKEKPDLEDIEQNYKKNNINYHLFFAFPGPMQPDPAVNYEQTKMVVNGSVKFEVDGKEFILKDGDKITIPKDKEYKFGVVEGYEVVVVTLNKY